jgi:HAD superfamily hydrolase (TIGR01509 family)
MVTMIRAIIFDFDGLILETEEPTYQAWAEIYQSFGFALPFSTWMANVGTTQGDFDPRNELERLVNSSLDWEQIELRRRAIENQLIETQPALPGAAQYLKDARRLGYKVGIASNSPIDWVTKYMGRLGLADCVDHFSTSEHVRHIKPDPEIYLNALCGLDVRADEAIALEDSLIGVRAARRAGIFCVAVPNPLIRGVTFAEANYQLQSLEEMPLESLLQRINPIKTQGAAS